MAKLSADGKYVTVEKGDTLYSIAKNYGKGLSYKQIAQLNGISDPNKIYIGQRIKLTGVATGGSSSSSSSSSSANSNMANVTHFGLQSNSDNTLFAVWTWNKDNTEKYEVEWYYDTGDNVWFVGSKGTTEDTQSTCSIQSNAIRVKFRVKPVSKTHTSNGNETTYWTAQWSTEKIYNVSENIVKPLSSPPEVKADGHTLTATVENINGKELNATGVEFEVGTVVFGGPISIFIRPSVNLDSYLNRVSYSWNVAAGGTYMVRARAFNDTAYSEWTAWSNHVQVAPSVPAGFVTCEATSEKSVRLEWLAVIEADSYDIEYATELKFFDDTNQTSKEEGITLTHRELTDLEPGKEYFFRLRAVNEGGKSEWSEISSLTLGKKPSAPTTWSSTTTAITGEAITLYWVHNSVDGSSQKFAELEIYIDGEKETHTIKNSEDEEEKDKTSHYEIYTSNFVEGTKIQWRVRTSGVTLEYGDWSIQRTVDVYAQPILNLRMTDVDGNVINTLTSFPFYIDGLTGPNTQKPISYHLAITSNEVYETTDRVGNPKMVNVGTPVYSKSFDTSDRLLVEMSAGNIDLENNIKYTVTLSVAMNSGLTIQGSLEFTVSWTDERFEPNAEINLDKESAVVHIRPYCEEQRVRYYEVGMVGDIYTKTDTAVEIGEGYSIVVKNGLVIYDDVEEEDFVYTSTGEQVFAGTTVDGRGVAYCTVSETVLVENVLLSVYRREFDGSFTEIASGIENGANTFVTDPHPSLDYARYRIVATSKTTGAVGYYDLPGYPIGEKAVIIQWDEQWTRFEIEEDDELAEPPWAGSLLRLPYNIDVTNSHAPDVSLIEYVGRKHPVSYYGTQLGESASWSVEIPKSDKETLYALRRLAVWMGDVYVREPSGSGYWASVTVSFSQAHCNVTIPVTLDITRVEGGM